MKTTKLFLMLALTGFMATAQTTWKIDKVHSKVRFSVAHMVISEVEGDFTNFSGKVTNTKADFSDAQFSFNVDLTSVDTDNTRRDADLKSPNFFDVEKYPDMTFKSTSLIKKDDKNFILKGNLTLHGVTKSVSFNMQFNGVIKDPWGNTRSAFKVTGNLNRFDYGLKYNSVMDNGGLVVGKDVNFTVRLETIKSKK